MIIINESSDLHFIPFTNDEILDKISLTVIMLYHTNNQNKHACKGDGKCVLENKKNTFCQF